MLASYLFAPILAAIAALSKKVDQLMAKVSDLQKSVNDLDVRVQVASKANADKVDALNASVATLTAELASEDVIPDSIVAQLDAILAAPTPAAPAA